MSHQDKIYNQNGRVSRNSIVPVPRTSSDICVFNNPLFNMIGGDKIECVDIQCDISSIPYGSILDTGTQCFIENNLSGSCFNNLTWATRIYEDDDLVYHNDFFVSTELTGATPSLVEFSGSVITAFDDLGYDYSVTDTTYTLSQISGVKNLKLVINTELNFTDDCPINSLPIIPFTGTCEPVETIICDETYQGLTTMSENVFAISGDSNIELAFNFSGSNTTSLIDTDAQFKFEIYKYNKVLGFFTEPAIFISPLQAWSSISGTSAFTETIPTDELALDGDYLVKGYYVIKNCTEFANLLGLGYSTEVNKLGDEYRLYNAERDFHFVALTSADEPIIEVGDAGEDTPGAMTITSQILPGGTNDFKFPQHNNDLIVTLNGLTLARDLDYSIVTIDPIGEVLRLSGDTYEGDILTYTYNSSTTTNDKNFKLDVIDIIGDIEEGPIDGQGNNKVYLNTTTGKYELFTEITPLTNNAISVSLNGMTLANGIDYYQSTSNPNRIILEGTLLTGDLINLWYNTGIKAQGDVFTDVIVVEWRIISLPAGNDGKFVVELAKDMTFNDIVNSIEVDYVQGQTGYSTLLGLVGNSGDKLFYRVKNVKNYVNICGGPIISTAFSDTIDITIQTNSINSY